MIIMKLRLRHNITIAAICMLAVMDAAAQKSEFNPVTTGVTSLSIAPDARGASMGDLSVLRQIRMPIHSSGILLSMHSPTARRVCR